LFTRKSLGDWSYHASELSEEINQVNSHKNARLTFEGRKLLIERIAVMGLIPAAEAAGISRQTVRKWLLRFGEGGEDALRDRTSRPDRIRSTIDIKLAERIELLRRARMPMRRIATLVARSVATISRFLAGLGLSSLKALDPVVPTVRYEREAPGELLHIDTKKLGRIVRPSHRVTGDRRDSVEGAGWEFAHVAIHDHSRVGFVQMRPDEKKESAVNFLKATVAHYRRLGVTVKRLLTDNGSAYRSKAFRATCKALGIKHTYTRPYRPPDQWQGRALHPDLRSGMGLRPGVEEQRRTHGLAAVLPGLLQRPQTAFGLGLPASSFPTRWQEPTAT
jgi:transposase InsO family protein